MALSASPVVDRLVGIGLRSAHVPALRALRPSLGFLEVHSENYFADGGAALAELMDLRAIYPIALHGVGLSLGSAVGVDEQHLARLARLVERVDPVRVSDHASFARAATDAGAIVHAADLLPLPFNQDAMGVLVANIQHVQERLGRPILIENLSAYLAYEDDEIDEPAFLAEVCRRSGCQLLLDLNNLLVNGLNRARRSGWQPGAPQTDDAEALRQARASALDFVWSLPAGCVGQFHLAGFRWPQQPEQLVIDDHSQRISPTLWDVFEQALLHVGERPTAVEWDVDLPPLAVLLDEARLAAGCLARAMGLDGPGEGFADGPEGQG